MGRSREVQEQVCTTTSERSGGLYTKPRSHMDSTWTPHGVYLDSIWSSWTFGGVHVEPLP